MLSLESLQRGAMFPVEKIDNDIGGCNIIDKRTGRIISQVSRRYELVPNDKLLMPLVEKFGIEKLAFMSSWSAGKSYMFKFYTGREFDFGDGKDIIKEQVVLQNSYDKTRSFAFMMGAFRTVCSNGLYVTLGSAIAFKQIHVGKIPVEEIVTHALNHWERNDFGTWKRLKEIPLSAERENEIIGEWQPFEIDEEQTDDNSGNRLLNRRVKYGAERLVQRNEDINNQRNGWGLFNQMNQAINRNLPQKAYHKKIAGNRRLEQFLKDQFSLN